MSSSRLTNYLRTHRKRARLSQDEVAFLLGSRSAARISRHERCRQTPNLRTLIAYELLFRTPIRELYSGASDEVEHNLRNRLRLLVLRLTRAGRRQITARKLETLRTLLDEEAPAYHTP
jgi:transcriptional regulator with XRE-family HTH domain